MISFRPQLLRASEFLKEPANFQFYDIAGTPRQLRLSPGSLACTYCQVPVVLRLDSENLVTITLVDGTLYRAPGLSLDRTVSHSIFDRSGSVAQVECRMLPA